MKESLSQLALVFTVKLQQHIKFGASLQNINNNDTKNVAPTTLLEQEPV